MRHFLVATIPDFVSLLTMNLSRSGLGSNHFAALSNSGAVVGDVVAGEAGGGVAGDSVMRGGAVGDGGQMGDGLDDGAAQRRNLVGALLAKTQPYKVSRFWGRRGRRIMASRDSAGCYHVMSRTCGGGVFFDEEEKEGLRALLWKMCRFSGIELLTYCVMGNHFHALVRVPNKGKWLAQFEGTEGEERLLAHLRTFYSRDFMAALELEISDLRAVGREEAVREKLATFKRRFCNLAIWMKEMKERYSRWYNRKHQRTGTLWMGRFKSVLVEGRSDDGGRLDALRSMALYIDLNPVRAGLVDEPERYRWSGYGEAVAGAPQARAGICQIVGAKGWGRCGAAYRVWLYTVGREGRDDAGTAGGRGIDQARVADVMNEFGRIWAGDKLRSRIGSFTEGAAVGSRPFVEGVFDVLKEAYRRTRRAANPMPTRDGGLHVLSGSRQTE